MSPGGIHIPDAHQDRASEFIVRALGPGKKDKHGVVTPITEVSVGDRVIVGRYSTTYDIFINDKLCRIIDVDDVMCVVQQVPTRMLSIVK